MDFLDSFRSTDLARWLGLTALPQRPVNAPAPKTPLPSIPFNERFEEKILENGMKVWEIRKTHVSPILGSPKDKSVREAKVMQGAPLEKFFRYVRNYHLRDAVDGVYKARIAPHGGITFYIELDAETDSFAFGYAMCRDNENFRRSTARAIAKGRFDADDWYEVVNYDSKVGIVENIKSALRNHLHPEKKGTTISPVFSSVSPKMKLHQLKQIFERI